MDKTQSDDQIKPLQAVFSSNDRLLLPLTTVPSCLCEAAVCNAVAAKRTCPQAPDVSRLTYFVLWKVSQLPQEPLHNKDTILSSLDSENVIACSSLPNDISFVYNVFTTLISNQHQK